MMKQWFRDSSPWLRKCAVRICGNRPRAALFLQLDAAAPREVRQSVHARTEPQRLGKPSLFLAARLPCFGHFGRLLLLSTTLV